MDKSTIVKIKSARCILCLFSDKIHAKSFKVKARGDRESNLTGGFSF